MKVAVDGSQTRWWKKVVEEATEEVTEEDGRRRWWKMVVEDGCG